MFAIEVFAQHSALCNLTLVFLFSDVIPDYRFSYKPLAQITKIQKGDAIG